MEHIGYYLWEGIAFSTILFVGTGLLVLRRTASGRPAFTDHDRQLFFGRPAVRVSKPRFYINFGIAVFLCYLVGSLEVLLLARFGASILATAELLTLLGIVKKWLC
ncbi:MAG TPA: hypothetical protein VGA01_13465 [Candidatus Binatia bacterium]